MLSLAALRKAGFEQSGLWRRNEVGAPSVAGTIPKLPGVYLFVVDDKVHYVGKADKSLHTRVGAYSRTLRRSKRLRLVHKGIEKALNNGTEISIYTLVVTAQRLVERNGLPVDYLIGLEAGLIEALNPDWNPFNSAGRAKRASVLVGLRG
jgi:hypothetical protein